MVPAFAVCAIAEPEAYAEKARAALTRREQLVRQLEAELRPVLRPADFEAFDFDRAFARVVEFAGRVR